MFFGRSPLLPQPTKSETSKPNSKETKSRLKETLHQLPGLLHPGQVHSLLLADCSLTNLETLCRQVAVAVYGNAFTLVLWSANVRNGVWKAWLWGVNLPGLISAEPSYLKKAEWRGREGCFFGERHLLHLPDFGPKKQWTWERRHERKDWNKQALRSLKGNSCQEGFTLNWMINYKL